MALDVAPAEPFLIAAAKAMGIDALRLIDTGLDPGDRRARAVGRRQQHPGDRAPASPSPTSATSRPTPASSDAGIDVVAIAGSELGSGRGGPRCMSCPIVRDPLTTD